MIAAAIIAGGQATRFGGRDKSRLIIEGQSIISRQLAVLQPLTDEVFVVASHEGERFSDLGLAVHPDRIAGAGVLGAILTALEVTRCERVFCVACDLPFLDPALLRRLDALAQQADGAWVRTPSGAEPLVACYQRHAAGRIREEVEAGRLKAADLGNVIRLGEINLAELETFGSPLRLLANVNTPEDHGRLVQ